jgi:hypothetical protein
MKTREVLSYLITLAISCLMGIAVPFAVDFVTGNFLESYGNLYEAILLIAMSVVLAVTVGLIGRGLMGLNKYSSLYPLFHFLEIVAGMGGFLIGVYLMNLI